MRNRLERLRERTHGYTVTPRQYTHVAYFALGALTLIVLTGAAVRLSGSGLGCPDWPKCYGKAYPPFNSHALIEFANRLITVPVSLAAAGAWVLALRRRPYRRDLTLLGALLPLGVVAQAVLGGFTVLGARDHGLRHPPPRRDRARLRAGRRRRLVARAPARRRSPRAPPAHRPLRAARPAGGRRSRSVREPPAHRARVGARGARLRLLAGRP